MYFINHNYLLSVEERVQTIDFKVYGKQYWNSNCMFGCRIFCCCQNQILKHNHSPYTFYMKIKNNNFYFKSSKYGRVQQRGPRE